MSDCTDPNCPSGTCQTDQELARLRARVQELTAERDEWKQAAIWEKAQRPTDLDHIFIVKERDELAARLEDRQRDEVADHQRINDVRAELAAANARCAELEADRDWEKAQKDALRNAADRTFAKLTAENAALQETLDRAEEDRDLYKLELDAAEVVIERVTALADEWNNSNDSRWIHAEELLAALTPEGKPEPLPIGDPGWVPDDREVKFVVRMADAMGRLREELAEKVETLWVSDDFQQVLDNEERLSAVLFAIQSDEDD